jgi:protein-S-isoprenylcysteine O-methyltransferase Ste14
VNAIAWAGAVLFVASLGYFLFTYAVTFGETVTEPFTARPIVIDAALFLAFALHHSVFARERVRALVARVVSPALERSVYVWVASLMLIGVCALWQPVPGVAWEVRGAARWLVHGVQLLGLWLTVRSAAIIDIWDLSGVRQAESTSNSQPPTPERDARQSGVGDWVFTTDGPYGWVRHPIYLGWFLLVFAMPRMTMTRLVFALVSGVYILIAIPFEERSLQRASAGLYQQYRKQVRWKLVPWVY